MANDVNVDVAVEPAPNVTVVVPQAPNVEVTMTGPPGAKGDTGPQGGAGPQGQTGPQGLPGPAGSAGPKGDAGAQGLQGPKGDPGLTGATGTSGATGAAGAAGSKGDQGDPGPQGPVGATGPKGDTGSQGPQGLSGATGATGPAGPGGGDVYLANSQTFTGANTFQNALTKFIGNAVVQDAATPTKAYRFRTSGNALDFEGGGADMTMSVWSNAGFTGTQYTAIIMSASGGMTQLPLGANLSAISAISAMLLGVAKPTNGYSLASNITVVLASAAIANSSVTLGNAFTSNGRFVMVVRTDSNAANTLTIGSSGGDPTGSLLMAPGEWRMYVGDSSGSWRQVNSNNTTDFRSPVVTKSTNYPLTLSDETLRSNGTAALTHTLPTAVGNLGKLFVIKNVNTGAVTVATTSSQLIDGSTTYSLPTQYKYVAVRSNGVGYDVVGNN